MNVLRSFVHAGPVGPGEWGPVMVADSISMGSVGILTGLGVSQVVMEPTLYPGELDAVTTAETELAHANTQLAQDRQKLDNVKDALGNSNPAVDTLEAKVGADQQTISTVGHRLDVLPNHSNELAWEGIGAGVLVGLAAAGIKLAIRKVRTDRIAKKPV